MEFADAGAIRAEIARVVPAYAGIEGLERTGDAVQWGGERLCEDGAFPTPDGRGHFTPVAPTDSLVPDGKLRLSTRRGKQFNTMVFADRDPLTGADRDAVFLGAGDAARLGVGHGDRVLVLSLIHI